MAEATNKDEVTAKGVLTQEQDALLDLYIKSLDNYYESIQASESIQVEIETLHLKRILTK